MIQRRRLALPCLKFSTQRRSKKQACLGSNRTTFSLPDEQPHRRRRESSAARARARILIGGCLICGCALPIPKFFGEGPRLVVDENRAPKARENFFLTSFLAPKAPGKMGEFKRFFRNSLARPPSQKLAIPPWLLTRGTFLTKGILL